MTVRSIFALSCNERLAARLFPGEFRDLRRWFVPERSTVKVPAGVETVMSVMLRGGEYAQQQAFMVWVDPDARRQD